MLCSNQCYNSSIYVLPIKKKVSHNRWLHSRQKVMQFICRRNYLSYIFIHFTYRENPWIIFFFQVWGKILDPYFILFFILYIYLFYFLYLQYILKCDWFVLILFLLFVWVEDMILHVVQIYIFFSFRSKYDVSTGLYAYLTIIKLLKYA